MMQEKLFSTDQTNANDAKDEHLYDAEDVASALGLKGKRMVIEQARKWFGSSIPVDKRVKGVKLPQGGRSMGKVVVKLSKEQVCFLVSRSRSNTAAACAKLGIDVSYHSLYRGEQVLMSLIDSILYPTQFNLIRQHHIDGYLLDGVIVGVGGVIVIEYDEIGHKYTSSQDTERQEYVTDHFLSQGVEVAFMRVLDSEAGISSACKEISFLVHSDFLGPVVYESDEPSDLHDCSVSIARLS